MIDLKPYGAFIEHTIRPLIEELGLLCDRYQIRSVDCNFAIRKLAKIHIISTLVEAIKTVICTAIIGYVAWTISR